jgi:NO-binding membrane sensor protein with MHYT domain
LPVIDFLFTAHEPALIVLAATICLVSSYACIGLTRHARRASGRMRNVWTMVAAMAVGFGIWATHFVAVLAFRPGFTLSYDIWLTAVSLAIAIVVCGAGIAMASRGKGFMDRFLGGAVVGVAISSMHYTGIAALIMGGRLVWNPALVGTSILAGIAFGGLALAIGMAARSAACWPVPCC